MRKLSKCKLWIYMWHCPNPPFQKSHQDWNYWSKEKRDWPKKFFHSSITCTEQSGFLTSKLDFILLLGNAAANRTIASPIYSYKKSAYYKHIIKDWRTHWMGWFSFGLTKFVEQLSKNFFYLTVRHSESKR